MKYVTMGTIMTTKDVSKDAQELILNGFARVETQYLPQFVLLNVGTVSLLRQNTVMTEI